MADEFSLPEPQVPSDRRFKWLSTVWIPIICVLTGALLNILYNNWSDRIRFLQYYAVTSSGIVSKPALSGKTVKILVDEKPVENISTADISIFNTTDQDYEDVTVDVIFSSADGSTISPIQENLKTEQEFFTELPQQLDADGKLHFKYHFKYLNRSKDAALVSSYYFSGGVAPVMHVAVLKKGLNAEKLELPNGNPLSSNWILWLLSIVLVVSIFVSILAVMGSVARSRSMLKLLEKTTAMQWELRALRRGKER